MQSVLDYIEIDTLLLNKVLPKRIKALQSSEPQNAHSTGKFVI